MYVPFLRRISCLVTLLGLGAATLFAADVPDIFKRLVPEMFEQLKDAKRATTVADWQAAMKYYDQEPRACSVYDMWNMTGLQAEAILNMARRGKAIVNLFPSKQLYKDDPAVHWLATLYWAEASSVMLDVDFWWSSINRMPGRFREFVPPFQFKEPEHTLESWRNIRANALTQERADQLYAMDLYISLAPTILGTYDNENDTPYENSQGFTHLRGLFVDNNARFNFLRGENDGTQRWFADRKVSAFEVLRERYIMPSDGDFYFSEPFVSFAGLKPAAAVSNSRNDLVLEPDRNNRSIDPMVPMPAYVFSIDDQNVWSKKGGDLRRDFRWNKLAVANARITFTAKDGTYPVLILREQTTDVPQHFLAMSVPTYHFVPRTFTEGTGSYLKKATYEPRSGILDAEIGMRGTGQTQHERFYVGSIDAVLGFNYEVSQKANNERALSCTALADLVQVVPSSEQLESVVNIIAGGAIVPTKPCDLFAQIAQMPAEGLALPAAFGEGCKGCARITGTPKAGAVALIVRGDMGDGKHSYNIVPGYRANETVMPLKEVRYYPQEKTLIAEDLGGARVRYSVGTIDRIIAAMVDEKNNLSVGPLDGLITFEAGQEGMPDIERYLPVASSDYEGPAAIVCEEEDGALDQAKGAALVKAMADNNRTEVEKLLCDAKTDVNAPSAAHYTDTPLHWAALLEWPQGSGHLWQHQATRQLIERGASMHKKRTLDNKSALELARDENKLYSLRFLIDCAQMLGRYLVRAIHKSEGDAASKWLVDWLLENPNTDVNTFSTEGDYYGDTPLVAMLKRDWPVSKVSWQQEAVLRLLKRGANPDLPVINWAAASEDWWTIQRQPERANLKMPPSKPAIAYGSEQARTVAKGMAAKYKDRAAPTVWEIVLDGKQMPEALLPQPELSPKQLGLKLVDAIVAGDVARVRELLDNPTTDVNAQKSSADGIGNTPLTAMAAVDWPSRSDEHRALADKLLERGADIMKPRVYGNQTPVMVTEDPGAPRDEATKEYFKAAEAKAKGVTAPAPAPIPTPTPAAEPITPAPAPAAVPATEPTTPAPAPAAVPTPEATAIPASAPTPAPAAEPTPAPAPESAATAAPVAEGAAATDTATAGTGPVAKVSRKMGWGWQRAPQRQVVC